MLYKYFPKNNARRIIQSFRQALPSTVLNQSAYGAYDILLRILSLKFLKLNLYIYSSSFNCKTFSVVFHELLISFHIFGYRIHSGTYCIVEHLIVKVVSQALAVCLVYHVIRQQSDSPCAALAGCLHNVNRSVNSACKDSLSDTLCLEQTAVS